MPDPASPLVISTRELARRPGTSRRDHKSFDAPEDLGSDIIAVPKGNRIEWDFLLESVLEGVLVTGSVSARARGACVRCLDGLDLDLEVDVQELFVYPERHGAAQESGDQDAEEERVLHDDCADLGPSVRDAIVLALPFQPVCRDDCPGLCAQCGQRLAEAPGHQHEVIDSRWSALAGLLDQRQET